MESVVHVEVARNLQSNLKRKDVEFMVKKIVEQTKIPENFNFDDECHADLRRHVSSVRIYEDRNDATMSASSKMTNGHCQAEQIVHSPVRSRSSSSNVSNMKYEYHIFELNEDGEEAEYMDEEEEEGQSPASHHWVLPSKSFDGLWDSLIFESDIKTRLMEYVKSAILFSEKGVNSSLISWNKVVLLHGPPGTGKTSLCKALAQKAVIQLGHRFNYGQFVEINSHSLFSKWFSESGKLVMKMFEKIHELIEDSKSLVFLLIDEVESLAQCRQSAEAGNEPADSIRAVNALLTQIDRIKRHPNVVILTTSNVVGAIDLAFVDRADLKIFIGPPPAVIAYDIYATCLNELLRVGIISSERQSLIPSRSENLCEKSVQATIKMKLLVISEMSVGLSGRTLRKIPFLTHANFVRSSKCGLEEFLNAMMQAVQVEKKEVLSLKKL